MIDKELAGPIATVVAVFAAAIVGIAFGRAQYRIALSQAKTAEAQKQIAKAQLDIAYDRLKQDFFEKRYEIYIAAKTLIEAVYKEPPANPADPEIKKLRLKLDEARFFFPPDTREFCEEIDGLAYTVLVAFYLSEKRPEHVQRREEAEITLSEYHRDLAKRFERDLGLEQLTRKTEIGLPELG